MLNIRFTPIVVCDAGLLLGPVDVVTEQNEHEFNHELIQKFNTGSPAFMKIENCYSEPTVPSKINRKTLENFFDDLVLKEFYRLPGNVETFIDEIMAGKLGYVKLRKGDEIRAFQFGTFPISGFIPNVTLE